MRLPVDIIDKSEVVRYLGGCGAVLSPAVSELIDQCIQQTLAGISPRVHFARFPLERSGSALLLAGPGIVLPGGDIARRLKPCAGAFVLCATLGFELDTLIRAAMISRPDRGVVLDACGSAAIERLCDLAQTKMQALLPPGQCLTARYSPGYGDLPLSVQPQLLRAMDSHRQIGLAATPSHMLTPQKSVTALAGIAAGPAHRLGQDCHTCPSRADCRYRRCDGASGSI